MTRKVTEWGGVYWPRNDTEGHGIGEGMIGGFACGGFTTKDTEPTKRTGDDRGGKAIDDYRCSNQLRAKALTGDGAR
jgi:hypothetical protein